MRLQAEDLRLVTSLLLRAGVMQTKRITECKHKSRVKYILPARLIGNQHNATTTCAFRMPAVYGRGNQFLHT
jgi:hypothetical protein